MWNARWLNQLCDSVKLTHKHLPRDDEWWKCSLDLETTREKNSSASGQECNFSATGREPNVFALSLKMPLYKCRRIFNSHTFLPVTESPRGLKSRAGRIPLISIACPYCPLRKVLFSLLPTARLTEQTFLRSVEEVFSTLVQNDEAMWNQCSQRNGLTVRYLIRPRH